MVELQPLEDLTVWNPGEIFIRVCWIILSEHWEHGEGNIRLASCSCQSYRTGC